MADEKTTTKTTMDSKGVKGEEGEAPKPTRPGEYATPLGEVPPPAGFKDSKFSSTAGAPADTAKEQGTYVENIPGTSTPEGEEEGPLNKGNEAPDVVARQPTESAEEAGERIAKDSKESEAAAKKEEAKADKA